MTDSIDFFFDFMSPFSYLAHIKLPDLCREYNHSLVYHPMDIPRAKKAAGNYGPSNREVPAKIKVLMADLDRWASLYDVPMKFPQNLDVTLWNRGVSYANDKEQIEDYVNAAYARIWGQGCDPQDKTELQQTAVELDWSSDEFLQFVESSTAKKRFDGACEAAHQRGVFGAPIMMLDDQVWWGNDRLSFVESYLRTRAEK